MAGLVPAIHVLLSGARQRKTWMAGTSPAMTWRGDAKRPESAIMAPCPPLYQRDALPSRLSLVGAKLVEARLLFIGEGAVEIFESRLHDLDRLQHAVEP